MNSKLHITLTHAFFTLTVSTMVQIPSMQPTRPILARRLLDLRNVPCGFLMDQPLLNC